MIKIRQFTEKQLQLFDPQNNFLGFINNAYEALDVCLQVVEQQVDGYYFMFGNEKIVINKTDGIMVDFPRIYNKQFDISNKLNAMIYELKYKSNYE